MCHKNGVGFKKKDHILDSVATNFLRLWAGHLISLDQIIAFSVNLKNSASMAQMTRFRTDNVMKVVTH